MAHHPAMTFPIALSVVSLGVSLFLLYRTELRRARMSLRVLAAPGSWTAGMARRGSSAQSIDPAHADYLFMHGLFAVAVTNDGPRGGAVWDLGAAVDGLSDAWRIQHFNCGVDLPYALPGRSCEGWSRVAIQLACNFDRLDAALRDLQLPTAVTFRITYACQNWRGRAHQASTVLEVPRASLLAGLEKATTGIDLATCQAVPLARSLVADSFNKFGLNTADLDRLTEWALLTETVEYVTIPESAPDRITVRHSSGAVDQGWAVAVGKSGEILAQICQTQQLVAEQVEAKRAAASKLPARDVGTGQGNK
jgi:hypothetical protein